MLTSQFHASSYLVQSQPVASLEVFLKQNREIVESAKQTLLQTRKLIARANTGNKTNGGSENDAKKEYYKRRLTSGEDKQSSDTSLESSFLSILPTQSSTECGRIEPDDAEGNDIEIRIGEVYSRKNDLDNIKEGTSKLIHTSSGHNQGEESYLRNRIYRSLYEHERLGDKKRDIINELKASFQSKHPAYSADRDVYHLSVSKQRKIEYSEPGRKRSRGSYYTSYQEHINTPAFPPPNAYLFPEPSEKNISYKLSQQWKEIEEEERQSPKQVVKNNKTGYLCNVCGKVYCRKYVLKIHQRVHSGEKPLQCRVCGKCFSDPSNMKKHVKLHDAEHVTYPCRFCGRHFIRRRGLLNHIRSIHSKEISGDYLKHVAEDASNNTDSS